MKCYCIPVSGVYGASWNEDVWGVDLITAELAISAGRDPAPFLKKSRNSKKALAQIWVTTNQDKDSDVATGNIGELGQQYGASREGDK
jgi:hypothetical protein